jgi:hypothetical protein
MFVARKKKFERFEVHQFHGRFWNYSWQRNNIGSILKFAYILWAVFRIWMKLKINQSFNNLISWEILIKMFYSNNLIFLYILKINLNNFFNIFSLKILLLFKMYINALLYQIIFKYYFNC